MSTEVLSTGKAYTYGILPTLRTVDVHRVELVVVQTRRTFGDWTDEDGAYRQLQPVLSIQDEASGAMHTIHDRSNVP